MTCKPIYIDGFADALGIAKMDVSRVHRGLSEPALRLWARRFGGFWALIWSFHENRGKTQTDRSSPREADSRRQSRVGSALSATETCGDV